MTHETRFAQTADGVYLAYQAVGDGPVDVVMDLHALAGNVDLIWDEPDWGPFLAGLTEFARLIIHDRRGSGVSTRNVPPPNLETRAADLLAVLDAIGSEAPVLGAGASTGAMHALFAATYPDRASGIVWNYPRPRLAWLRTTDGDSNPPRSTPTSPKQGTGGRQSKPASRRRTARHSGWASRTTNVTRCLSTRTSCGVTRASRGARSPPTSPRR